MKIAIAVAAAVLAALAGVLLAAYDLPSADGDRRVRRLSLVLVIATAVTATAGAAYALLI